MDGSYLNNCNNGTEMNIWVEVTLEATRMALRWEYGQTLP